MRMAWANSMTSSKYRCSVWAWAMTSVMLFFQMELAKWRDRNFSGLPVALANLEGSRVEELVTSTVLAGSSPASFL